MKVKERTHSEVPLLEIIFTIGIFAIISIVILQMFLGADTLRRKAEDISRGTIAAETVIESIKGMDSIEEAMKSMGFSPGPEKEDFDENYILTLGENWEKQEEEAFRISVDLKENRKAGGTLQDIQVTVIKKKPYGLFGKGEALELLTLSTYKYQGGEPIEK